MKIIILDTNIVFSAILNPQSRIGEVLFGEREQLGFYTVSYLRFEINKHKNKMLKLTNMSEEDINESIFQIYKRINFVSDEQIPMDIWYDCAPLVRDIDMDDLPFVALTVYLDGLLWTGDLKLRNGLISRGFDKCITTAELIDLMIN